MVDVDVFFDGASRGNPGKSGAGCFLQFSNNEKKELYQALGTSTNNQAEYQAVILGLKFLLNEYANVSDIRNIMIRGDSQLVVKQLNKEWRVKDSKMRVFYDITNKLLDELRSYGITISIKHIRREKNSIADRLANLGADNS